MRDNHLLLALLIVAPLLLKGSCSPRQLSSSSEKLNKSQSDCFPGLVYDAAKNSCLCTVPSLFTQGFVCQENGPWEWQISLCVTNDWDNPEQVVGGICPYSAYRNTTLPEWKLSPDGMNSLFCEPLNRTQTLCGRCAENYSLAINSYDFQCLPSKNCKAANVLTVLLTTFGPLSAFYCLIFLLQVNVSASYMFPYILLSQTLSLYVFHVESGLISVISSHSLAETLARLLISFYNVWNLDVLTLFMPPICVHEHVSNALAISLQYFISLYPLLMILLSYFLVKLYDRDFKLVVWTFLPIKKCFSILRVRVDPISSLLTTFATFFFLSFSRATITSLMLLSYTDLLSPNGTSVRRVFLYDATMDYLGPGHLPYALLALFVGVVFIILPLLLVTVYPTKPFHRWIEVRCSFQKVQSLTTFMELYQGHFKDGTEGTADCRYFAGLHLVMRLTTFVLFFQTQHHNGLDYFAMLILYVAWCLLIVLFAPYKKDAHNKLECSLSCYASVILATASYINTQILLAQQSLYLEATLYIALFLPPIVTTLAYCIWICMKCSYSSKWLQILQMATSSTHAASIAEVQPLMEPERFEHSSSNKVVMEDRFAQYIGTM